MDNTLDYVSIGKRIRAARKRRKWSIDKLALLSNISRPHMGHIETGATKLSLPALVAIANALEVTADELLCDTLKCSKAVYENELSLQLANANTQQMKLVSELAKVVLRDEFKPSEKGQTF